MNLELMPDLLALTVISSAAGAGAGADSSDAPPQQLHIENVEMHVLVAR
jgi:hypothetical protein